MNRRVRDRPDDVKRLSGEPDGKVSIHVKSAWRNGRTGTRLEAGVFALRLASLRLPPRVNAVRTFGVFAPASPLRSQVVPRPKPTPAPRPRWTPWEELIQRVFGRDPDRCPECGERMTWQATILSPTRAWEVLDWVKRHGQLARDGPGERAG